MTEYIVKKSHIIMNFDKVFSRLEYSKTFDKILIKLNKTNTFQAMNVKFAGPFIIFSQIDKPDFILFSYNFISSETTVKSRPAAKLQSISDNNIEHVITFKSKTETEDFIIACFTVNAMVDQFINDRRQTGFSNRVESDLIGCLVNDLSLKKLELKMLDNYISVFIKQRIEKKLKSMKKPKEVQFPLSENLVVDTVLDNINFSPASEQIKSARIIQLSDKSSGRGVYLISKNVNSTLNLYLSIFLTNERLIIKNNPSKRRSIQPPSIKDHLLMDKGPASHIPQTSKLTSTANPGQGTIRKPDSQPEVVSEDLQNALKNNISIKAEPPNYKSSSEELPVNSDTAGSPKIMKSSNNGRVLVEDLNSPQTKKINKSKALEEKFEDTFLEEVDAILENEKRRSIKQTKEIKVMIERRNTILNKRQASTKQPANLPKRSFRRREPTFKLVVDTIDLTSDNEKENRNNSSTASPQIKGKTKINNLKNEKDNVLTFLTTTPKKNDSLAYKYQKFTSYLNDVRKPDKVSLPELSMYIDELKDHPPQLPSKNIKEHLDKAFASLENYGDEYSFKEVIDNDFINKNNTIIVNSIKKLTSPVLQKDDLELFNGNIELKDALQYQTEPFSRFIKNLSSTLEIINNLGIDTIYFENEVCVDLIQILCCLFLNGLRDNSLSPAITFFVNEYFESISKISKRISEETDKMRQASILVTYLLGTAYLVPVLREAKRRQKWASLFYSESALMNSETDLDLALSLLDPLMNKVRFNLTIKDSILSTANAEFVARNILCPAYGY